MNLWQHADELEQEQVAKGIWIDSRDILHCMGCALLFTMFNRKVYMTCSLYRMVSSLFSITVDHVVKCTVLTVVSIKHSYLPTSKRGIIKQPLELFSYPSSKNYCFAFFPLPQRSCKSLQNLFDKN